VTRSNAGTPQASTGGRPASIPPGATIGVLGGGQLGRMFAMAARRLGYRVHTLAPEHDTPTGQIADVEVRASYDDIDQIRAFARGVDVVTFEFENVPAAAASAAADHAPVRPSGTALHIAQHRTREKTFLARHGLPVTAFAPVTSAADLDAAVAALGRPAVLKTASFGYDGKGQAIIGQDDDPSGAWDTLGRQEAILESFVDLEREISVIGARGMDGASAYFTAIENEHRRHILDVSVSPAAVSPALAVEAVDVTRAVMDALDYVGILCVEFFVTRDGRLLINELAPRPHNSGHLTFDACRTSQFEQQVRAICGLPLGSPELLQPAAMANVLGELWAGGEPNWSAALSDPAIKLHLYGKATPRPGRKMGHLTALADDPARAKAAVLRARERLGGTGVVFPVR
jgi:5-(carboxyamino)imidazole ribonucleotide synthase